MRAPNGESRARGPGSRGLQGSPDRSTRTSKTPARGPAAASSVGQGSVSRRGSRRRGGRYAPPAPASAFAPFGRRRGWVYTYRCPGCGGYQVGRAQELEKVAAGAGQAAAIMS